MTRVLLVCPEPLGHGQPAGVGIRFIEIAKVLAGDDHRITVLSPDGGAVAGAQALTMTPETIASATGQNDVAIVQGHAANSLFAHGRALPTVVDLYDPFIIENLHYYAERGDEVFTHDFSTLMVSLARGDFFLCASEAQRLFYLGLLLASGRVNPIVFESDPHLDGLIGLAPFGVQPPRTQAHKRSHDVLFGGIYDWYDPILAIEAIAVARRTISDVTITFTTHPNPDLTPQGKHAEAIKFAKGRGYREFVRFEPWAPYAERGRLFDRFAIAVLTFRQSIETDLSMRTRIFDYLWGGLPVITSSAAGTDEILLRYGAGAVIRDDSAEAFGNEIARLLENEVRLDSMKSGAASFVSDHQWSLVLEPLREFCNDPHTSKDKNPYPAQPRTVGRGSMLDRLKRRIGGAF